MWGCTVWYRSRLLRAITTHRLENSHTAALYERQTAVWGEQECEVWEEDEYALEKECGGLNREVRWEEDGWGLEGGCEAWEVGRGERYERYE